MNAGVAGLPVISHAADFLRRYPGEALTFFTRVEVPEALSAFRLRVTLPDGLAYKDCRSLNQPVGSMPLFSQADGVTHLIWDVDRETHPATQYEFWVKTVVESAREDCKFESKAVLTAETDLYLEEIVTVAVQAKGRYLRYLPNIYQEDELMGRFLMLFESFLGPIEMQIDGQPHYYDPQLAPKEFLPWLASWTGLVLDDQLGEKTRRTLLKESAALYRKRGTRQGLQEYLEIYTGGQVQIIEHFSENFRLGPTAYLGPGIALGSGNLPNTFSVHLCLPAQAAGADDETGQRAAASYERKIETIIAAEKPVHTGYDLHIEYDPTLELQD